MTSETKELVMWYHQLNAIPTWGTTALHRSCLVCFDVFLYTHIRQVSQGLMGYTEASFP